jgi:hypothetical protein
LGNEIPARCKPQHELKFVSFEEKMAAINIPEDDLPALKQLMSLPDASFDSLLVALGKAKPTFSTRQLATNLSAQAGGIATDEILPILNVACALYYIKERADVSSQKVAKDVSEAAGEMSTKEIEFPKDKLAVLEKRLGGLLNLDKTLGITAKALDVMTEHEHVFCSGRILSDIRPVFTGSPESADAALIVHNLQIGFHNTSEGKHQEIYIALDTDDLEQLKDIIARAEKKTMALRAIINKSEMTYLEV